MEYMATFIGDENDKRTRDMGIKHKEYRIFVEKEKGFMKYFRNRVYVEVFTVEGKFGFHVWRIPYANINSFKNNWYINA